MSLYSSDPPAPGSGLSIAKKFLLTLLTQFADRKIFVYLFHHNYKGMCSHGNQMCSHGNQICSHGNQLCSHGNQMCSQNNESFYFCY